MAVLGQGLPWGVRWVWSSWLLLLPDHRGVAQQGIPRETIPGGICSFPGAPRGQVCGGRGQEH